jgi:hypothetical protein
MKYVITAYKICVPLNKRQWGRLTKMDSDADYFIGRREKYDNFLKDVKDAGGEDYDFNGHFGRNFFFTSETIEQVDAVMEVIKKHLKN